MSVDPRRRYVSDLCCGRRVSVDVGRIVYILISAVSADAGRRRVSNLAVVGLCLQMPEGYLFGISDVSADARRRYTLDLGCGRVVSLDPNGIGWCALVQPPCDFLVSLQTQGFFFRQWCELMCHE